MELIRYCLLICLLAVWAGKAEAQSIKLPRNSVFLEILGNGGLFSINYERTLPSHLHLRMGFGQWSSGFMGPETTITTFPFMLTHLEGNSYNHLEWGAGMVIGHMGDDIRSRNIINLAAFIGYRYQPRSEGIMFRAGFTPSWSLDGQANYPSTDLSISGGVSLGYHF